MGTYETIIQVLTEHRHALTMRGDRNKSYFLYKSYLDLMITSANKLIEVKDRYEKERRGWK